MNVIKKSKLYLKDLIGKDSLEFVSHAKNYISADFFAKGLSFISIPIFTRLLTPDDYGILAIFTTIVSIFAIFLKLNIHGSITRYYYEDNKDFKSFLGSNLNFISLFNLCLIPIIYLYKDLISDFFGVTSYVFIMAIIVSLFQVPLNIFLSYLQASKDSKRYSTISILKNSIVLIIAIIWTYLLVNQRYLGKIYAQILITLLIGLFCVYNLVKLSNFNFKLEHIKYSLSYGIPLIPHALSGFILAAFDKVIINQLTGATNTGLYSFAYQIGMIMNIIVMAMNRSWVPIFYDNLKSSNYKKINELAYNYSKYIYLVAIGLILFSKEIVTIMADKSYYDALNLVPVIVIGYVFVFLYTLYANYSFYRKRTGLISIATLLAGFINIGLNYWLILKFGYKAAALTTLISYLLLFVFHYINTKLIIKEENLISLKIIVPNFLIVLFIGLISIFWFSFIVNYIILLMLKIIIFVILTYYFILRDKC